MIRRVSRREAICRKEAEAKSAKDSLSMEELVDIAVDALAKYGVNEIEYEEGEEPEENEAICADEEGNEVGIEIKGDKLKIDLDEEEDIIIDLNNTVDDVKAELDADLESKLAEQEEAEECSRKYEEWKRRRNRRMEKRIPLNRRGR